MINLETEAFSGIQSPKQSLAFVVTNEIELKLETLKIGCKIGVASLSKVDDLQKMLLPTYDRQLVVFQEFSNSTKRGFKVHLHHYPILLLSKGQDTSGTVLNAVCKEDKIIDLNMHARKWIKPITFAHEHMER